MKVSIFAIIMLMFPLASSAIALNSSGPALKISNTGKDFIVQENGEMVAHIKTAKIIKDLRYFYVFDEIEGTVKCMMAKDNQSLIVNKKGGGFSITGNVVELANAQCTPPEYGYDGRYKNSVLTS